MSRRIWFILALSAVAVAGTAIAGGALTSGRIGPSLHMRTGGC